MVQARSEMSNRRIVFKTSGKSVYSRLRLSQLHLSQMSVTNTVEILKKSF